MNATAINAKAVSLAMEPMVNAWLMAKTLYEVEREKMDALDRELLAEFEYSADPELCGGTHKGQRITEPKDAYLMKDAEAQFYYAERQQRIDAMGYKLPRGHCPALCAETVVTEAERVIIAAAAEFFPGINAHRLLCAGLDKYHQFIDLIVKLVVNRPDYRKPRMVAQH